MFGARLGVFIASVAGDSLVISVFVLGSSCALWFTSKWLLLLLLVMVVKDLALVFLVVVVGGRGADEACAVQA